MCKGGGMRNIEGILSGKGLKFAIVVARFNDFITEKLLQGAKDCLIRHEVKDEDIDVYRVPGAFEIPQVTNWLIELRKYDGIICLGAIIRGETPHFDYIASQVSRGLAQLSLQTKIPIGFGILTTDSTEQAIERAGAKLGNKGFQAALSVLELINLKRQISP